MPAVALDCLEGGGKIGLRALGRPAVVNLWASWCLPCRQELPAIQRYASDMGGRVLVIGVDTGDTRDAGSSFLHDIQATFPNAFDERKSLLIALGRTALPVTVFIDAQGGLRYLYNGPVLDETAITRLAGTYLGVSG